jgi:hypothetical protein
MSYDITDLDVQHTTSVPASMGWSSRGGIAVSNDATDRFLMRLAITALSFEEMELRDALPFPVKAREALSVLASYLHDIGYISEEAIARIAENTEARNKLNSSHGLEFEGDIVLL